MTVAYCKNATALAQDLLPGRECEYGFSCRSSYCKEKVCNGRDQFDNCVSHSDCGAGLYCQVSKNWPFNTICVKQRDEYEECTEDFECKNNQFCWYPNRKFKESNVRTCMKIYS